MAQDDNPSISPEVTEREKAWLQQAEDIRLPASTRIDAIENLAREYQAAWHAAWPEGEPPTIGRQSAEQATKIHSFRYKAHQIIDRLSLLLHNMEDDRNVRRALVRLLPNWGEDGLRTLLPALKMPDLRSEAIKVLDSAPVTFQFGRDPGVLDRWKEQMRTDDQWKRAWAASVLCGLGETEAAFGAVSDPKARVRKSLAVAIGYFNEQRGAEVLRRLLTDEDAAVSRAARISLERLENPEVEVGNAEWAALLAPHGNAEWAALLKELSDFRLTDDPELRVRLAGEGKIWLGETGATETQITALEQRIGQSLPPSYRSFLMASNGFQWPSHRKKQLHPGLLQHIGRNPPPTTRREFAVTPSGEWLVVHDSIPKLYGTEEVDWFRVRHPQLATGLAESCLQVSATGECFSPHGIPGAAVILLRPPLKSPDGEWRTFFFAGWRHSGDLGRSQSSFGEFMSSELPNCEWMV